MSPNDSEASETLRFELQEARAEAAFAKEAYRLLVEGVKDYAIYMLDSEGRITTWNSGAEKITGYAAGEVTGKYFGVLYDLQESAWEAPEKELAIARELGRSEWEGWRYHKNGSRYWANTVITAIQDEAGTLIGFSEITRDVTERKRAEEEIWQLNETLEQKVAERTQQLEALNKELETFSYTISHDLRAPLRGLIGYSQALFEDYYDKLDGPAKEYLDFIQSNGQRMSQLVNDILALSKISRTELVRTQVDLSELARQLLDELRRAEPERNIDIHLERGLTTTGDPGLLKIVLQNLLENAWKFTQSKSPARIEFARCRIHGAEVFYIKDNGAGFDMRHANKLFIPFQRLHKPDEFTGTGIGLATILRIINRHGGKIWGESQVGEGAVFYFVTET